MYNVWFEDLQVWGHIGVTEAERAVGVRLAIDLNVALSSPNPSDDDLSQALDYGALIQVVSEAVAEGTCKTLEHLCHRVSMKVFERFRKAEKVVIRMAKCPPPISASVARAGVQMAFLRPETC